VVSIPRDPPNTQLLWVREGGGEASRQTYTHDRTVLNPKRPEDFELWVAATGTPGLCLDSTLEDIRMRTDFLRRVHYCNRTHKTGGYEQEREAFAAAWADRSLDESETQNMIYAVFNSLRAPLMWLKNRKKVKEARALAALQAKKEEERLRKELLRSQVCLCVLHACMHAYIHTSTHMYINTCMHQVSV
jgi:hypothetical protein